MSRSRVFSTRAVVFGRAEAPGSGFSDAGGEAFQAAPGSFPPGGGLAFRLPPFGGVWQIRRAGGARFRPPGGAPNSAFTFIYPRGRPPSVMVSTKWRDAEGRAAPLPGQCRHKRGVHDSFQAARGMAGRADDEEREGQASAGSLPAPQGLHGTQAASPGPGGRRSGAAPVCLPPSSILHPPPGFPPASSISILRPRRVYSSVTNPRGCPEPPGGAQRRPRALPTVDRGGPGMDIQHGIPVWRSESTASPVRWEAKPPCSNF